MNGGEPWTGTKAAYKADKANLVAQGYVRTDAEEAADPAAEGEDAVFDANDGGSDCHGFAGRTG